MTRHCERSLVDCAMPNVLPNNYHKPTNPLQSRLNYTSTAIVMTNNNIEHHPLQPFTPSNAKVLLLGSFPPQQQRWSMNFFYPNFQNDMWRIMGLIFFGNRERFVITGERRFDHQAIVDFCTTKGIALFDTAQSVRRLRNNASDNHLQVVTPTNIDHLLDKMPQCQAIATTGTKAAEIVAKRYGCDKPLIADWAILQIGHKCLKFYRLPSSSRAYPLALERKAKAYQNMFEQIGLIKPSTN